MGLMLLILALILILLCMRVSVGALVAAAAFPVCMHVLHPVYFAPSLLMAVIVWIKHRKNIGRIVRGEEPKLNLKK
jgi:glycerol-3-phosphate acyltransferase PlsY